ncbi:MAG: DUF5372 family protein [Acidimicrobiales bacterium]
MTHPFHPWVGRSFEFVVIRRTWKQDRVFFLLEEGTLTSVPTAWTDAAAPDPWLAVSAGRSAFRTEDLLMLAELVEALRPSRPARTRVRRNTPPV